jgi:hypothetical protein
VPYLHYFGAIDNSPTRLHFALETTAARPPLLDLIEQANTGLLNKSDPYERAKVCMASYTSRPYLCAEVVRSTVDAALIFKFVKIAIPKTICIWPKSVHILQLTRLWWFGPGAFN